MLLALRWLVQPERLGALILARAEALTGLRFAVAEPARLGVLPALHLQLEGLEITDPAHGGRVIARADAVALYLPLSVLHGPWQVQSIALDGPRVYLDALVEYAVAQDQTGPPAPPWLPAIARLEMRDGALILSEGKSLHGIDLRLEQLLDPDAPLRLEALAVWSAASTAAIPVHLHLAARNPTDPGRLGWALDTLELGDGDSVLLRAADGRLEIPDWSRPRLALAAILSSWPGRWPPLPPDLANLLAGSALSVSFDPADPQAVLALELRAPDRRLRIATDPLRLADWVRQGEWLAPLPAQVEGQIDRLQREGIEIEGLRIEHDPDAAD